MDGIPNESANSKMTHFQCQPIHPISESEDMEVEITSSFDTRMNTSLSLSFTSQNQRNAINESNSANQISLFTLDDSGAFSGCKSKSVTASTFSDESIVSRGTPLVMKFDRIPFKNITNTVCFILTESNIQIVPPFPEKELLSSENVPTESQDETNTPHSPPNVMLHSDWPIKMFRNEQEYINSGYDVNSSLIFQKLMSIQFNAAYGMHLAHLGDPGNSSRLSVLSESENASLSSPDETIRYGGRSSAMVIDELDDDKEMYYNVNNRDTSSDTLVNHSRRSSAESADIEIIPYAPATVPLSMNFNFVGVSVKGQVRISDVPVIASLQRGQFQLKCHRLNKYQPVHLFELLDASTGRRANRSTAGKQKDDNRNLKVCHYLPNFSNPVPSRNWISGWGLWSILLKNIANFIGIRV
jgi:hypothetical protein